MKIFSLIAKIILLLCPLLFVLFMASLPEHGIPTYEVVPYFLAIPLATLVFERGGRKTLLILLLIGTLFSVGLLFFLSQSEQFNMRFAWVSFAAFILSHILHLIYMFKLWKPDKDRIFNVLKASAFANVSILGYFFVDFFLFSVGESIALGDIDPFLIVQLAMTTLISTAIFIGVLIPQFVVTGVVFGFWRKKNLSDPR